MSGEGAAPVNAKRNQPVKCLVWDLDNTLWQGILVEDGDVSLRPGVLKLLQTLDSRGILQSIASKNDSGPAMARLHQLGIAHFFLYPEVHWKAKSGSIQTIAKHLNIALDSIAFIDDQPFEREEVSFHLPEIRTYPADELDKILLRPEFSPEFVTEDAKNRRLLYQQDLRRSEAEQEFEGTNEAFLRSLKMKLRISPATESDLVRMEELTQRTHQLNTTGIVFSQQELRGLLSDSAHELLLLSLEDRFGSYGKIGIVLLQKSKTAWRIRLLLLSCRVMSRGIGNVLLTYLKNRAYEAGVKLEADFKATDRNRMMYMTYKFAGFEETESTTESAKLQFMPTRHETFPDYLSLEN